MGEKHIKIDFEGIDFLSLQAEEDFRREARRLLPQVLVKLGEAAGTEAWDNMQRQLRSIPGFKPNISHSDKHKFIREAGRNYERELPYEDKKRLEDRIVQELREQRKKIVGSAGTLVSGCDPPNAIQVTDEGFRLGAMSNRMGPRAFPRSERKLASGDGSLSEEGDMNQSQERFSRRQVERSFRKFKDIVHDLLSAKFQTWSNTFTHLITHCEEDAVMRVVTAPLRANRRVDASKWYEDCMASVGGMVGTARYELPYDDEDRTALLYQFLLKVERDSLNIQQFCINAYGTTSYQEMVDIFNRELVLKFAREVSYRLDEIMADIGNRQEVSRDAMVVFHYHDHSVSIHGNVQGSNVAAGTNATVSGTSATFDSNEEVATALRAMLPLTSEVVEGQRQIVECAIQTLVRAAEGNSISAAEVEKATSVIAVSSSTLRQRLGDIAGRIGVSLTGSAIFQAIKMALGVH